MIDAVDPGNALQAFRTLIAPATSFPLTAAEVGTRKSARFALMSLMVARRTREIGIRVALGSPRRQIVSGIFARAFLQIAIGILAGSALVAPKIDFASLPQVTYLIGADAIMLIAGSSPCSCSPRTGGTGLWSSGHWLR